MIRRLMLVGAVVLFTIGVAWIRLAVGWFISNPENFSLTGDLFAAFAGAGLFAITLAAKITWETDSD